ncbi:MAG TPA: c-type cytochrome biogenesis protein CcsB [Candidatus Binataceae bacterium]|nr:c-type cytochrome biogenesis protein CcsB [Candidatus Binataceae bacterium]
MMLWLVAALLCYALSFALFAVDFSWRVANLSRWAIGVLSAAVIFHAGALIGRGWASGNLPVGNFPEALSFLAWLTALLGLFLIIRFRLAVIGALVASAALIALGAAEAMSGGSGKLPHTLRSLWLPVHVSLAFLGEALLLLAAVVSVVYLFEESRLKAHRPLPGALGKMPSLERLDQVNYRLLGWGFLLLSLAILSGALWARNTWGHFWSWEPRESWALVTWVLYAALLESRLTAGWRGRRAATLTIMVFVILAGSFVGLSLLSPGKHGGSFG